MSFFSIIIPLYNKEKFIESTLKSVFDQYFTDFEILIVNDGSTDLSEEKAKQFKDPRIRYFLKENGGASSSRNYGIERAQSNYVTFLDADDYWYPNFLQEMYESINRFPELKVFSAAIEIETSRKIIPAVYSIEKTNDFEIVNYFKASSKESVIWTSCAVFHKNIFEEIGHFDTKIKSGQDTDLWIRIGLVHPVLFSWKILARYVYDDNSLSKNKEFIYGKMNFSKFEEIEKNNPCLKKFLDLNRCSIAIRLKINKKNTNYKKLYKAIDLNNLTIKKRILLVLPALLLKNLVVFQKFLSNYNLSSNVFK